MIQHFDMCTRSAQLFHQGCSTSSSSTDDSNGLYTIKKTCCFAIWFEKKRMISYHKPQQVYKVVLKMSNIVRMRKYVPCTNHMNSKNNNKVKSEIIQK